MFTKNALTVIQILCLISMIVTVFLENAETAEQTLNLIKTVKTLKGDNQYGSKEKNSIFS